MYNVICLRSRESCNTASVFGSYCFMAGTLPTNKTRKAKLMRHYMRIPYVANGYLNKLRQHCSAEGIVLALCVEAKWISQEVRGSPFEHFVYTTNGYLR